MIDDYIIMSDNKTTYDHLDYGDWFMMPKGEHIYMKTTVSGGCYSCVNVKTGVISPIAWDTSVIYVTRTFNL